MLQTELILTVSTPPWQWQVTSGTFWMAINCELDLIAREEFKPVEDWEVTIHPPIIVESQLPCQTAFTVFSRAKNDKERVAMNRLEDGIIMAGGSEPIYSASPQDAIYLMLFPSNTVRSS